MGSPLLAWRPLALLVTGGGSGGDRGGPPPGGSGFRKLGPRDMGPHTGTRWEEVIGVAIGLAATPEAEARLQVTEGAPKLAA